MLLCYSQTNVQRLIIDWAIPRMEEMPSLHPGHQNNGSTFTTPLFAQSKVFRRTAGVCRHGPGCWRPSPSWIRPAPSMPVNGVLKIGCLREKEGSDPALLMLVTDKEKQQQQKN